MKQNTKKTAFAAMMTSLGVVFMYLGSLVEILDLSTAALASLIIVVCMVELGSFYPYAVFAATGILAFLVLPGKTVSLAYIFFFGLYPIAKKYLEKIKPPFSLILKFVLFNLLLAGYYVILKLFFPQALEDFGLLLAIPANIAFFAFDRVLTLFMFVYLRKIRSTLHVDRFFR